MTPTFKQLTVLALMVFMIGSVFAQSKEAKKALISANNALGAADYDTAISAIDRAFEDAEMASSP